MRRKAGTLVVPQVLDVSEQRFYVVMHHLATVLWMKGAAVEALTALRDVLEETSREQPG